MPTQPTDRYCFTHHKCASNWMRMLLLELCQKRRWGYTVSGGRNNNPLEPAPGKPTFYIRTNARLNHAEAIGAETRAFHLIRDPRDALVSGYWSWAISHNKNSETLLKTREQLKDLPLEDGLILMLDHVPMLDDLKDWPIGGFAHILDVRYEDLLADTPGKLRQIFDHLQIEPLENEIERLVENSSFESITGRKPGEENVEHHFRKGVAGDWKNSFTPRVTDAFKARFQDQLVALGYETDDAWTADSDQTVGA